MSEKKKEAKKAIPIAVRTAVWNKYIGETYGVSKCFVNCGNTITQANFQCGHVVSESDGGSIKIENLRPVCQRCNTSMGTKNMHEFMEKYGFTHGWWSRENLLCFSHILIVSLLSVNIIYWYLPQTTAPACSIF